MTVESATYISGLNATLPTGADAKAEGDDHIRLLKSTILATFPGMTGAMTGTHTQLNKLVSTFSIASASANAVTVDASGNVGVGAASPTAKIEAGGSLPVVSANGSAASGFRGFRIASSGIEVATLFSDPGSGELRMTSGFGGFGGLVTLWTAGLERMRIDANGNVIKGINAAAPSLTSNGALVFSLPSDTQLQISVRGSDGVTRTANIALA